MSAVWWFVIGGVVWTALAVVVAVLVGRAIVRRDRQKPRPPLVAHPLAKPDPKVVDRLRESVRRNPPSGPRGNGGGQ